MFTKYVDKCSQKNVFFLCVIMGIFTYFVQSYLHTLSHTFSVTTVHRIQIVRSPLWDGITHQFNLWQHTWYDATLDSVVSFL